MGFERVRGQTLRKMTSNRPYLIRAYYDWIVDNGMTPYITVDATMEGAILPQPYVRDGQIILNISPRAVQNLQLGDEEIAFSARFAGSSQRVAVPPNAVVAIYARENGEGMLFGNERERNDGPPDGSPTPSSGKGGKPALRVVK
jgi:stringent starvation protein B